MKNKITIEIRDRHFIPIFAYSIYDLYSYLKV